MDEAGRDLLACATFLAENIRSSEGRGKAMQALVPRYLARGEVDLAAELADAVEDPFVRDRLLAKTVERCGQIDDDDYAFQLLDAIDDHGTRNAARERLALAKSAKGETTRALEIVDILDHPDDALADIALHLEMNGESQDAIATLDRIDFPPSKANALQNMAQHHLKEGANEKAGKFFEAAVEAAGDIEFQEERVRVLLDIAANLQAADMNERSAEILDSARIFAERIDGVHRDGLFARIALGLLRAGDEESAAATLDLIGDKSQKASCMASFADHYWNADETEAAHENLEEAYAILKSQKDRETRDTRFRLRLLAEIAVRFAQFGKHGRAMEIAFENIDELQRISALSRIAQVAALRGDDSDAREALGAISDEASKMFALIGMSDARSQAKDEESALALLKEAHSMTDTVPQVASRAEAYRQLAERYKKLEKAENARACLKSKLNSVSEIRDETRRSLMLAELDELFSELNAELEAEETELLAEMVRKSEF